MLSPSRRNSRYPYGPPHSPPVHPATILVCVCVRFDVILSHDRLALHSLTQIPTHTHTHIYTYTYTHTCIFSSTNSMLIHDNERGREKERERERCVRDCLAIAQHQRMASHTPHHILDHTLLYGCELTKNKQTHTHTHTHKTPTTLPH